MIVSYAVQDNAKAKSVKASEAIWWSYWRK
jgi:hypothetical protein